MKQFKRSLVGLAFACALASGSAQAAYWFDADAAGAGSAIRIESYLDYVGALAVGATYDDLSNPLRFAFTEYGVGSVGGRDSTTWADLFPAEADAASKAGFEKIGVSLTGNGFGVLGGSISITNGALTFYSPKFVTEIARFSVTGGGANIAMTGATTGQATLNTKLLSAEAGYFFADNSGIKGTDFTLLPLEMFDTTTGIVHADLVLQTTVAGQQNLLNKIDDVFAPALLPDLVPGVDAGRPTTLVFASNGQYELFVPEPASLVLCGIGLLGLGVICRRKNAKVACKK